MFAIFLSVKFTFFIADCSSQTNYLARIKSDVQQLTGEKQLKQVPGFASTHFLLQVNASLHPLDT